MPAIKRSLLLLLALLPLACKRGTPQAKTPADPGISHVVIVSIDGLRPDLLLRAHCPNIRWLMQRGSYTMWANTTEVGITLPSHASMLTGVAPNRHDIWWDENISSYWFHYPNVPTLFDLAKKRGLTTAISAGKSKFIALARPGSIDWSYIPEDYANNLQTAEGAAQFIEWHKPNVVFVHMPDADAVGHGSGWGSVDQVKAIEKADRGVGMVLNAIRRAQLASSTVVIVTADHGGAGHTHGGLDPRSHLIPWIICGPGIRKNFDLTMDGDLVVNTEDTFATACVLLGLPLDEDLDGKAITQAMEEPAR